LRRDCAQTPKQTPLQTWCSIIALSRSDAATLRRYGVVIGRHGNAHRPPSNRLGDDELIHHEAGAVERRGYCLLTLTDGPLSLLAVDQQQTARHEAILLCTDNANVTPLHEGDYQKNSQYIFTY